MTIHPAAIAKIGGDESAAKGIIDLASQLIATDKKEAINLLLKAFPLSSELLVESPEDLTRSLKTVRALLDLAALNPAAPQVTQFLARRSAKWATVDRPGLEAMRQWLLTGIARKDWEWLHAAAAVGRMVPARYPWSHPTLACWRAETPTPTVSDFRDLQISLQPHSENTPP
jgi:hypothetical protein